MAPMEGLLLILGENEPSIFDPMIEHNEGFTSRGPDPPPVTITWYVFGEFPVPFRGGKSLVAQKRVFFFFAIKNYPLLVLADV